MKKLLIIISTFLAVVASSNISKAQTVAVSAATVITCNNVNAVSVSGTLTGSKGIPITGYTVDLISAADPNPIRIITNNPSSGGAFNFVGFIPSGAKLSEPFQVKVTTNRQANSQVNASTCK